MTLEYEQSSLWIETWLVGQSGRVVIRRPVKGGEPNPPGASATRISAPQSSVLPDHLDSRVV